MSKPLLHSLSRRLQATAAAFLLLMLTQLCSAASRQSDTPVHVRGVLSLQMAPDRS